MVIIDLEIIFIFVKRIPWRYARYKNVSWKHVCSKSAVKLNSLINTLRKSVDIKLRDRCNILTYLLRKSKISNGSKLTRILSFIFVDIRESRGVLMTFDYYLWKFGIIVFEFWHRNITF